VVFATATLRILRPYLDAGDESLLYLPVVIVCAFKFGFGPAVAASIFSFGCWDYFFDVPYYALTISNAHDCISLAMYLVVAVTTAHLAARAKARRQVSEARERETALLYQASSALSCEVDTDRSLLTLAEQIIYLCHVSPCLIFLFDDREDTFETAVSLSASALADDTKARIVAMAKTVLHTEGLVRVDSEHTIHRHDTPPIVAGSDPVLWAPVGRYVPLSVQQSSVGVLYIGPRFDGSPLSAQDERMILTLANHAAVVIARQLMAEEAKEQASESAVLDERNRLARDVHDTLSHAFTGIKFLLEAAGRIDSPAEKQSCIVQARNLAIEGAQEARRSVLALRPAVLEQAGNLVDALRKLATDKSGDGMTIIEVSVEGAAPHIPSVIEENLLRICQEALTNALKHSDATRIDVNASFSVMSVQIKIVDNGRGFAPSAVGAGFGLTSMRERAALIGGELSINASPGEGTSIAVTTPLLRDARK
jgi:signal transduction histidine kinase